MAVNRYSLYPASFVHGGGTLSLIQINAATADPGSQMDEIIPGGLVDRQAVIMATARPSCTFSTADLATVLGTVSPTAGLNCTGACKLHYQQRADQGVFSGGSNNIQIAATKGFLMPSRITASGSGQATCDLMFYPLYDGTNFPLIATNGVSLSSAPTPAYNSVFYQGPVYVNSAQIEGLISVSVDLGLRYSTILPDGYVFATQGSIVARTPTISLTFLKADMVATNIGSMFIGSLAGTIAVYFARGVAGGTRVANATTSHCKISAATGALGPGSVSVTGEDDATVTVTVWPTAALAVSVASAIP